MYVSSHFITSADHRNHKRTSWFYPGVKHSVSLLSVSFDECSITEWVTPGLPGLLSMSIVMQLSTIDFSD